MNDKNLCHSTDVTKQVVFPSVFLWFWQKIEPINHQWKEVRFGSDGYFCYFPPKMTGIIKTEICCRQPDARLFFQKGPSFAWDGNVLNHLPYGCRGYSQILPLELLSKMILWYILGWWSVRIVPGETLELQQLLTNLKTMTSLTCVSQSNSCWLVQRSHLFYSLIQNNSFVKSENTFDN